MHVLRQKNELGDTLILKHTPLNNNAFLRIISTHALTQLPTLFTFSQSICIGQPNSPNFLAIMSFQLPSENDPFYKRFFMTILLFIQFSVEVMLPIAIGIVLIGMIMMLCGIVLGLIPNPTKNTDDNSSGSKGGNKEAQAHSSNPTKTVDEKTRVEFEMEVLREMLQARQEILDKLNLVKSD